MADLVEQALEQSGLESHECKVKCPKCGGTNVLLLAQLPQVTLKIKIFHFFLRSDMALLV